MSAPPSFSSFPPSFSSFPELDSGPSSRQSDSERPSKRSERDREKKHKHEKAPETKERRNSKSREREKRKDHDSSRGRDKARGERRERSRDRDRKKDKDRGKEKIQDREHTGKSKRTRREDKEKDRTKYMQKEEKKDRDPDLIAHDESYRLYFIDTKGDPLNLHYGGLYSGDVPKYHLAGGGRRILGLSNAWTVFRRSGGGIEVGPKGRRKLVSLSDSSARSALALPPTKKLHPSAAPNSKYEEIDGFIRLPTRKGHRDPEDTYRAIATSRDADSSSGSSTEDEEDESSDDSPTLTSHQLTIKNLEQELAENPRAVDKWISLLNHTLSATPITSRNATKARSEITVSILSRALSVDPRNGSSKLLRLRYMKAGEEIWHESKLRAEWEEALKVGGAEIWMEWLEWRIRNCTKGMDGIVEDVLRVYGSLGSDIAGELTRLRLFWRMAVVFRDAGFTEKAMAMFQAQSELAFNIPQSLSNSPLETCLIELEEFWESEVPRIGEEGAHGWSRWYASGKPEIIATPSSALAKKEDNEVTQLDPYRQWAFREHEQDQISLLPAKSFDDPAQSDPYATVLFSDIRALLFEIKYSRTRHALKLVWLSFLGLHLPGFASSLSLDESRTLNWDDRWNAGYLTAQPHLNAVFQSGTDGATLQTDALAGVLVGREKEYANSFKMLAKEWGWGVVGCLDIPVNASREMRSWWNQEDVSAVDMLVVRRAFAQLRTGNEDAAWDELALAFECAANLKSSLKLSRALLSTAQDSVLHWAAHAQLERLRGRPEDARKVYQTILIASRPARATTGLAILWWNWAELEWLASNDEQATNVILRSVNLGSASSGVVVLRAKRALEEAAEALATTVEDGVKVKEREAWIKLRALLEILTGKDVNSMLQVFDQYLDAKDHLDEEHEGILLSSLVMLYRYGFVLKNPVSPMILRERASAALEKYPSNSIILGIFLEGEKGQGVWGRVRGLLGDSESVGKMKDVARRVEEVWIAGWEKGRWRSEIERTRTGLAEAVESERTRASPLIWRVYLEFEIRAGDLRRAKKMLYRAIGECPLYKGLYLLAFGALRSVFFGHELNSLADLMAERGLRLRKGLDDVLEGWDMQVVEDRQEREDSGESEIEHRAEELRRLMPY